MIAAVDTNVLLDLLTGGEPFAQQSKGLLEFSKGEGQLAICETVFAELASQFPQMQDMERLSHPGGRSSVTSSSARTRSA